MDVACEHSTFSALQRHLMFGVSEPLCDLVSWSNGPGVVFQRADLTGSLTLNLDSELINPKTGNSRNSWTEMLTLSFTWGQWDIIIGGAQIQQVTMATKEKNVFFITTEKVVLLVLTVNTSADLKTKMKHRCSSQGESRDVGKNCCPSQRITFIAILWAPAENEI